MCLPIDSCFGFGRPPTDDDHYHAPAGRGAQHAHHNGVGQYNGNGGYYNGNGNGGHYYNGSSYPAHREAAAAASGAEADRKASNDVRKGPAQHHDAPTGAAAAATRGWHGNAATGAQDKAEGTLKQQQQPVARNGKAVADGAGARVGAPAPHNYYAYERAQPQPPAAGREDAADSYCMAAATASADHQRY